jgi:antitoxin YefM
MSSTYRLKATDLNDQFLQSLKTLYGDREIEIVVCETDETEYLLRSSENRRRLLEAIDDVEHNRNIVIPDQKQFQ